MTVDDLESPSDDKVAPKPAAAAAAADSDAAGAPATHPQHVASLTSHDLVVPTLPAEAIVIHGE